MNVRDRTTPQVALTAYGRDLLTVTEHGVKMLHEAMPRIEKAAKGLPLDLDRDHILDRCERSPSGYRGVSRTASGTAYAFSTENLHSIAAPGRIRQTEFGRRHFRGRARPAQGSLLPLFADGPQA